MQTVHNKLLATIHLEKQHRDGVLYVSSKDLPGLWLWGHDPEQVLEDVKPTIAKLYEYNEGLNVQIVESCPKNIISRWFGRDKLCDTFEVYSIADSSKEMPHGRFALEK